MDLTLPGGFVVPDVVVVAIVTALVCVGASVLAVGASRRRFEVALADAWKTAGKERERAENASRELVVERARGVPMVEKQEHLFSSLSRGFQDLAACRDRDGVAQALANAAERSFNPGQFLVLTALDRDGKEFQLAALGGERDSGWTAGARINDTMGRLGLVARRRVPMDTRDFETQPPIVREQLAATEPAGFLIDAAVPVIAGNSVAAIVAVGGASMSIDATRAGLEMLAAHAGSVLRAIEAGFRIERLRNTDAMTGLGSKSWFVAEGAEILYKGRTDATPSALVLFGIDDFKGYVRRSGHEAADWLLKGVAEVIKPLCKDVVLLARWSGAEFVLLLPGAGDRVALEFADRIRLAVATIDWPNGSQQTAGRLTLSAGVALSPLDGQVLDDLIETASERLILARRNGNATYGTDMQPAKDASAKEPPVTV